MRNTIGIVLATLLFSVQLVMCQAAEQPKHPAEFFGYGAIGALITGDGSASISQIGGGGETTFYKGLGVSADIGYMFPTRTFTGGFGTLSPGMLYQFSRDKKRVPFVTGGYTLAFRDGTGNMVHIGGGVTQWFTDKIGLRIEARDYIPTTSAEVHYFLVRIAIAGR